jgi:hypothetical protein
MFSRNHDFESNGNARNIKNAAIGITNGPIESRLRMATMPTATANTKLVMPSLTVGRAIRQMRLEVETIVATTIKESAKVTGIGFNW